MKPTLYYQIDEHGLPLYPFCYSAAKGAADEGIVIKPFYEYNLPLYKPFNIIVGSVEATQRYLDKEIQTIDDSWAKSFKKREEEVTTLEKVTSFPAFIKPATQIKAFTGFVAYNKQELEQLSANFKGEILKQEVVEIESEYRVYVSNLRGPLGIYNYSGNPYKKLDEKFVLECCEESYKNLTEQSYTLDFGIDDKGNTFLIEVNDGWAIGNYGMPEKEYYHFIKNRFLQLTGVLK